MRKVTYFAVFEPSEDGGYSVYFPDLPGCVSFGEDFKAAKMCIRDRIYADCNRLLDRLYPRLWYSDTSTRAVSHGENVARGGRYLWICYGRECKRRLEKIQESDEIKTLHTAVCIL